MGKIRCVCDNIISDVYGWHAESFTEDMIGIEDAYDPGEGRSILECNKCGCLIIEDPIGTCRVKFYLPENKKFNRLFRD